MGKMRKDLRDPKMGVHIKLDASLGEVDNGAFVELGKIVDNDEGSQLREGKALTEGAREIAIICSDGHRYDDLDDGQDIVLESGAIVRGYKLQAIQIFTIEMARLAQECVAGDYLVPVVGTVKLGKIGATKANAVAKVLAVEFDAEGNKLAVIDFL